METRKKLEEARFFLGKFRKSLNGLGVGKESPYYLSAFLSAWKSVLDVMLYDFAEYYSIGLTREDRMTEREFSVVAKAQAQRNDKALVFFKWWKKKTQELSENKLWKMRHMTIHRGYPKITDQVYVPETISSSVISFDIPKEATAVIGHFKNGKITKFEYTMLPKECNDAFKLVENIVIDAEKKFGVKL